MSFNIRIKEPGEYIGKEDGISQDSCVEEEKRALEKEESDFAKEAVNDSELHIRENPGLYVEIQERIEEFNRDNEGAVNRLDTIRTRLLDYFQFYDCHNSGNRTSDGLAMMPELAKDEITEENASTTSDESPDAAPEHAANLYEYYEKYKENAARKRKKKKLNFELDVFLKDLDYLIVLACKTDAKPAPWMEYEYLVDGKLYEFFELFLPYLSQRLKTTLLRGSQSSTTETKIVSRLKEVFEYTCSLCSAREVYTYTMANIEIYRKSVIFPMLLQILRRSLTRLDFFKRQRFIADAAPTILKCLTVEIKDNAEGDDDAEPDENPFLPSRINSIDKHILENIPPHVKRHDTSHKDLSVTNKSFEDDLGIAVEQLAMEIAPDVIEQYHNARKIPDPLKPERSLTEVGINYAVEGAIVVPTRIQRLHRQLVHVVEFLQEKDIREPEVRRLQSPFMNYASTRIKRVVTSFVLKAYEPWLHIETKYFAINAKCANVVDGVFQSMCALGINLVQDGWTYNEILLSQLDYMPWTHKGIQKILKDKDYKKDIDIEDPYFIKGYEPNMEKMDSDDEEETVKSKIYFSTKGIGLLAYMLLVLRKENELGDFFSLPQTYSKEYVLRLFIPIIRFMISYTDGTSWRNGLNFIQSRGIEMLTSLFEFVYDDILLKYFPIDCPGLVPESVHALRDEQNPHPSDDGDILAFAEAMITLTCTIEGSSSECMGLRSKCWQFVCKFIDLLTPNASYNLIHAIIETCPYTNVIGLLLDRVLVYVQRYYNTIANSTTKQDVYYISEKINEIVWLALDKISPAMTDGNSDQIHDNHSYGCDIYHSIDIYCSSFNIYRFLLIRDKQKNFCALWPNIITKGYYRKIQAIKYEVTKKIDARSTDLSQAHKAVKDDFQREILRLNMLADVLDRIGELVEGDERYLLLT